MTSPTELKQEPEQTISEEERQAAIKHAASERKKNRMRQAIAQMRKSGQVKTKSELCRDLELYGTYIQDHNDIKDLYEAAVAEIEQAQQLPTPSITPEEIDHLRAEAERAKTLEQRNRELRHQLSELQNRDQELHARLLEKAEDWEKRAAEYYQDWEAAKRNAEDFRRLAELEEKPIQLAPVHLHSANGRLIASAS